MLPYQQSFPFSNYSELYSLLIPRDNLLRRINELVDFSFVREELLSKYCLDNGRPAEDPVRMFKYLLLKIVFDLSDVDVVSRSLYDLSFKYFLGMPPEETTLISPSSLCKFRKLRLRDSILLDRLIGKTVSIAKEAGIIKSGTIIVDSTHTGSRSNPWSPLQILRLRSGQLRRSVYGVNAGLKGSMPAKNETDDLGRELEYTRSLIARVSSDEVLSGMPKVSERLNMLSETLSDIEERYTVSRDRDARTGHKSSDSSFFGYKTHIAMSEERIITAATVTSGEQGDGPRLPALVEQSRANGMPVDTVVGDTAYSGAENLALSEDSVKGFRLVSRLNPVISSGTRKDGDRFFYNKDAGMFVCPAGHMAVRKETDRRSDGSRSVRVRYFFDVEKCKVCPLREGCYRDGASRKTYSVRIKSGMHRRQEEFQKTDEFRERMSVRYMIEAKNSELKNVLGYDRATSYGLDCMRMQGAMTIFVANLRRILRQI